MGACPNCGSHTTEAFCGRCGWKKAGFDPSALATKLARRWGWIPVVVVIFVALLVWRGRVNREEAASVRARRDAQLTSEAELRQRNYGEELRQDHVAQDKRISQETALRDHPLPVSILSVWERKHDGKNVVVEGEVFNVVDFADEGRAADEMNVNAKRAINVSLVALGTDGPAVICKWQRSAGPPPSKGRSRLSAAVPRARYSRTASCSDSRWASLRVRRWLGARNDKANDTNDAGTFRFREEAFRGRRRLW